MASSTHEFATDKIGWPRGRWLRWRHRVPASFGVAAVLVLVAIGAAWLAPYNPYQEHVTLRDALQPPSLHHWLGTDQLGRDVFSRILFGAGCRLASGFLRCPSPPAWGVRQACSAATAVGGGTTRSCGSWTRCRPSQR